MKCPKTKSATHCLIELFPIYQNKHWTIRRRDDQTVDPSSHCIILKIVGFIQTSNNNLKAFEIRYPSCSTMATYWVLIIIICCFFRFSLGCSSQKSPDPPKCPTTKGPAELTRGLGDSTVDGKGVLSDANTAGTSKLDCRCFECY